MGVHLHSLRLRFLWTSLEKGCCSTLCHDRPPMLWPVFSDMMCGEIKKANIIKHALRRWHGDDGGGGGRAANAWLINDDSFGTSLWPRRDGSALKQQYLIRFIVIYGHFRFIFGEIGIDFFNFFNLFTIKYIRSNIIVEASNGFPIDFRDGVCVCLCILMGIFVTPRTRSRKAYWTSPFATLLDEM